MRDGCRRSGLKCLPTQDTRNLEANSEWPLRLSPGPSPAPPREASAPGQLSLTPQRCFAEAWSLAERAGWKFPNMRCLFQVLELAAAFYFASGEKDAQLELPAMPCDS